MQKYYDKTPTQGSTNPVRSDGLNQQLATIGLKIGDLANLTTTAKNNIVAAVNEVKADVDGNTSDIEGLKDAVYTDVNISFSDIDSCGGYIAPPGAQNEYLFISRTIYYGKVVPFSSWQGKRMTIASNSWDTSCRFAFLTNNVLSNMVMPNYCDGTTITVVPNADSPATYTVPADCNYLYVYAYSDGADVTPTVTIATDKIDAVEAELDAKLYENVYEDSSVYYSSDLTQHQCSLGGNGWYNTSGQTHVVLPVTPGDSFKVEIVETGSPVVFWNWLTSAYSPEYSHGNAVPSVSGENRYLVRNEDVPFTVTAPDGAAYLCLTTYDGTPAAISLKITKLEIAYRRLKDFSVDVPVRFRIAHWNIGHFALGAARDTAITHDEYDTMRKKWVNEINGIGADIFLCCEYNGNFVNAEGDYPAVTARTAVFPPCVYKYGYIGGKYGANMHAMFLNLPLDNFNEVAFSRGTQHRYYLVGDIKMGNDTVKVVEAHLDFNQDSTGEANRAAQIAQLISDFATYDYVIIGGDFNTNNGASEFDAFLNAGYNMVNHGYIGDFPTYPAGDSPTGCIDNIVCKGFNINGVKTVNDSTLTDHICIYADFTMIRK